MKSAISQALKGRIVRRRFRRNEDGSVAIEFALTAIPFFALIFAIFEAGIVFFATATLDDALQDASRLIRTGQAQTAGMSQADIVAEICNNVVFISKCTNNLKIDVRSYSTFSSVTNQSPTDSDGNIDPSRLKFQTGNAGDIVVVRVFYAWRLLSPMPTGLANNGYSKRLMQSGVAFRNEPYTS